MWLPFVTIVNMDICTVNEYKNNLDNNKLIISVVFNITRDPNTLESVQVEIGE